MASRCRYRDMEIDAEELRLLNAVASAAEAFMSNERAARQLQKAVNALKQYRRERAGGK